MGQLDVSQSHSLVLLIYPGQSMACLWEVARFLSIYGSEQMELCSIYCICIK